VQVTADIHKSLDSFAERRQASTLWGVDSNSNKSVHSTKHAASSPMESIDEGIVKDDDDDDDDEEHEEKIGDSSM
ncbi:hypothetical protein M9458_020877, partial [Cirrhinus mrigala]